MLIEALRLAWQAIGRNALRASLTVLGIVIGVAAVIAMVTIGKGATMKVTADIERLGGNLIFLAPGQWGPVEPVATPSRSTQEMLRLCAMNSQARLPLHP